MIGFLKDKSQYYTEKYFFYLEMEFSTQEFFLFTQELILFTQEILPLLPKKLRTSYSRNLSVSTHTIAPIFFIPVSQKSAAWDWDHCVTLIATSLSF